MKKQVSVGLFLSLVLALSLISSAFAIPAAAKDQTILEFDSMVGLPQAFTGNQNPIRGINGGGLPWNIGPSSGELKANGKLEISVRGLVFAAGPNTGKNTVPSFRAIVSCLTADGGVQNVTSDPFPADSAGNANIETSLALPEPCIAPLIFVTSPGGAWFATVGK
jgi:hypothetical protein